MEQATLSDRMSLVLSGPFSANTTVWPPLEREPASRTDRFLTLLQIYDLAVGPLDGVGDRARWTNHPAIAAVKLRLEEAWLEELDAVAPSDDRQADEPAGDPVQAMRSLAARNRLPGVYRWVAEDASLTELRRFLAIEGGPDGGFDDLVALCQVGLDGLPKLELAANYWDEMGEGDAAQVHTELHREMVRLVGIPLLPRDELPEAALERSALGGLLATNRWLQPEMLGALGLTELQAGPRCRLVLEAFRRLGLPEAAQRFYAVHADVDPRHGKDWLDRAIAPVAATKPDWRTRLVRGARWRWRVNAALFDSLEISAGRAVV